MAPRVMKIQTPFSYSNDIRTEDEPSFEVQCAVQEFDRHVWDIERVWGVDRLPALVSSETRQKWWMGISMLNDAIRSNNASAVTALVPNMISGLNSMIKEALALGYGPQSPDVWEAPLSDGRVFQISRAFPSTSYRPDSREIIHWSLEEVARMVEKQDLINKIKDTFPGATISNVS